MESNLVSSLMKDERDGEHLAGALADAERKAREFRQKASAYIAEAEKWELIAKQLQDVADLAKRPAASVPRAPVMEKFVTPPTRRRHGFWNDAIANAMTSWNAANTLGRGPTKRELAKHLMSDEVTEKEAMLAINHAVTLRRLSYRVDHLYLPGTAATHAAAD